MHMKRFATLLPGTIAVLLIGALASTSAYAQFERIVLLEELTSVTCGPCAEAGEIINQIASEHPSRLATIRYHTYFRPPADRFYEANKTESDARRTFYEVVGIPVVRVDGSLAPPATDEQEVRNRVEQQLATESPIRLEVTQMPVENGEIRVDVKATAGPEGLPAGYRLRVASVERFIHDPTYANKPTYNGEVNLYDVFRDLVPGPGGDEIVLGNNEVKTFSYRFPLVAGARADQMYAIAFVQDEFDKSVVQTGFTPRPTSSTGSRHVSGYAASAAAPNPTSTSVRIDYVLARAGELDAVLIDAAGERVRRFDVGVREAGSGALLVDVSNVPAGVYNILLSSGAWRWSDRIVVVR